ncbi:lysylphosphatidylglycerol synthase transmembrane domain-containing protein [Ruegeria intermedia]|nr:lysylphosphatidylglycerol synthase transmembrane domain-containing protein [Ruegeria intermedia]
MQDETRQNVEPRHMGSSPATWLLYALLFGGLSAAGFAALSVVFDGPPPRFDARLVQPTAIASILLFLLVYFVSDGLRLFFVLRTIGSRVKIREIFPLVFINFLFSNITPLATGGGFAQVWYLQRQGVSFGASAAATSIRTILAMLMIFIAAPAFQFLHPDASNSEIARITMQSLSGFSVLYLVGFILVLRRPFWMATLIGTLLGLACRLRLIGEERKDQWVSTVRRETAEFASGFSRFLRGSRRDAAAAVISTLVFLVTLFAFPALLLVLLDYDVDWMTVIGTMSVVTFLMYFAPTPGGAGLAELAFAGFMASQMAPADLLLVVFAWRFLVIYLGMGIGMVVSAYVLRPRTGTG